MKFFLLSVLTSSLIILSNSQSFSPSKPLAVAYVRDLYHFLGPYLTTIVGTYKTGNYSSAENFCRSNGFELFTITNAAVYFAFILDITTPLKDLISPKMWINGKQFVNNNWYAYNPKLALILNEMCPKISYKNSLNCLSFVSKSYGTQANNCSEELPFVCEIKRKLNSYEFVIVNSSTIASNTSNIYSTTATTQIKKFYYNSTTNFAIIRKNSTLSTTVVNKTSKP